MTNKSILETPLFAEIKGFLVGRIETIEQILRYDPSSANQMDSDGQTPLICATRMGDLHVVKLLIRSGANVLQPDKNLSLPLHHAAQTGWPNIVQTLLNATSNPKEHALTTNVWNRTAFWYSLHSPSREIFPILFKVAPEALFILPQQIQLTDSGDYIILDKPSPSLLLEAISTKRSTTTQFYDMVSAVYGHDWVIKDPITTADIPSIFPHLSVTYDRLFLDFLNLNPDYIHVTSMHGRTLMHRIVSSDSETAYAWVEEHFSIEERLDLLNRLDNDGLTPIHHAIINDCHKVFNRLANFLMTAFRNEKLRSKVWGCLKSPTQILLHTALKSKLCLAEVIRLIGHLDPNQLGTDLNRFHPGVRCESPIHIALTHRTAEDVGLLIRLGAVIAPTRSGTSPLEMSTHSSKIMLLRALGEVLPANVNLDTFYYREVIKAVMSEEEILKYRRQVYFDSSLMERLLYFVGG